MLSADMHKTGTQDGFLGVIGEGSTTHTTRPASLRAPG